MSVSSYHLNPPQVLSPTPMNAYKSLKCTTTSFSMTKSTHADLLKMPSSTTPPYCPPAHHHLRRRHGRARNSSRSPATRPLNHNSQKVQPPLQPAMPSVSLRMRLASFVVSACSCHGVTFESYDIFGCDGALRAKLDESSLRDGTDTGDCVYRDD